MNLIKELFLLQEEQEDDRDLTFLTIIVKKSLNPSFFKMGIEDQFFAITKDDLSFAAENEPECVKMEFEDNNSKISYYLDTEEIEDLDFEQESIGIQNNFDRWLKNFNVKQFVARQIERE